MRAFKIGARARKFALEGCMIEGYELLYTALAETRDTDSIMHGLLTEELAKFERRVSAMDIDHT